MKLYSFFRSGTSHRLRIALNLKGVAYEQATIDLRREQHLTDEYKAVNPQQLLPALDIDGQIMTQSPAIIEWLEERYPNPPLLPWDANERAHVRALTAIVGCDIHPVNNRRILEALRHRFGADEAAVNQWCGYWIGAGFDAFQSLAAHENAKARSPSASNQRSPTCTWCRKSRAHGASRSTWPDGPFSRISTRPAGN